MDVPWQAILAAVAAAAMFWLLRSGLLTKLLPAPTAADSAPAREPGGPAPVQLSALLRKTGAVCYGAEWCGFTRKQLSELQGEHGSYTYVDCEADKERCTADGVSAFPTWYINGKKHEGFMTRNRLTEVCS